MARFAPQALAISFALLSFLFSALASPVLPVATPLTGRSPTRVARQTAEPTFPSDIASCPICEQNYANINSCAQAAPVLQNFTMVSSFVRDVRRGRENHTWVVARGAEMNAAGEGCVL